MAQLLKFLWVWQTFDRGGATNLRGGVRSVADLTDRPNSKRPVGSAQFVKKEKSVEDRQ